MLRTLTNAGDPIIDGNGVPQTGVKIDFYPVDAENRPLGGFDTGSGEMLLPVKLSVETDEDGIFSIPLWITTSLDVALYWLCRVHYHGMAPFRGQVTTGDGPLSFLAFRASGTAATPAQLDALAAHIAETHPILLAAEANAVAAAEQTALDVVATAADRVQTGLDVVATAADRVQTGQDVLATAADRVQTGQDVLATAADRQQTGADVLATAADVMATAADRIQTGQDATATGADRVQTGADVLATAADRQQTGADVLATAADVIATTADRIQTGQDATATGADRVQTGQDATATGADRVQTGADVLATAADRQQTGLDVVVTSADRTQTGQDVLATAADREQTGLDAVATAADRAAMVAAVENLPAAPTQAQAEDITDVTGTLYSWPILRLLQLIAAWWATIKTILGQRDALISIAPGDGSSTALNYDAGSYLIDLSGLTAAHSVVFTSTNWPGAATERAVQEIFLKMGAAPFPAITWPAGWVTVVPAASTTNCLTVDAVGASAPTMTAGRTY